MSYTRFAKKSLSFISYWLGGKKKLIDTAGFLVSFLKWSEKKLCPTPSTTKKFHLYRNILLQYQSTPSCLVYCTSVLYYTVLHPNQPFVILFQLCAVPDSAHQQHAPYIAIPDTADSADQQNASWKAIPYIHTPYIAIPDSADQQNAPYSVWNSSDRWCQNVPSSITNMTKINCD